MPDIRYHFVSLGCPKNRVDSEVMIGTLNQSRLLHTEKPEDAEVIIINTCSFVQAARDESIDTILEFADYKEKDKGQCKALVVSGCLTQHYKDELATVLPEVDLFIGTGQYHRISELLTALQEGTLTGKVHVDTPTFIHAEKDPRQLIGPTYSAYLKIAEGCDRRCSFCIIPDLRGKQRSRSIESLVEEAKTLISNGTRELNLISQDTIRYGLDLKDGTTLEKLLKALVQIEGLEWLRLFYIYPDELSDSLIELIKTEEKICKYLDVPVQHLNTDLLKLMNRRATKEQITERIKRLKSEIPDIVLRTSVIVGHPGETKEAFEELLQGIRDLKFDQLGVFKYSKEENTRSAKLIDSKEYPEIPKREINRRHREVYKVQKAISKKKHHAWVGKTLRVLVEGYSKETKLLLQGRHYGQAPEIDSHVLINDGMADVGEFKTIQITEATDYELIGGILS